MMLVHKLVFLVFGLIRAKAELQVYFDDMSVTEVDPTYFDVKNTKAYITDDNTITSNFTLIKKIPEDAEGHFKLTGLSMGKYTMPTGLDIWMELCDILDEPIIVGPFFSVVGFSKHSCPPEPGTYSQEGYTLPLDNLPDDFPENKYMAIFEISLKGKSLLALEVYADVQT